MKNNKIFLLLTILLLQGCIGYQKSGYVIPSNWSDKKTSGIGNYLAQLKINTSERMYINSEDRILYIQMPRNVTDSRCSYVGGVVVPFYFSSECNNSFIGVENDFSISLIGKEYTTEFIQNINIYLVSNGKQYTGQKRIYKQYASFVYPVKIGLLENGNSYLLVSYKNHTKEIPIKYEMKWN